MVCLHLQVTPLFQEPLEVPSALMPIIKAAIMTCIAVVQLVNTRSLVQTYLNSGLRQWHDLKHGPPVTALGIKTGEVITMRLRVVNTLLVKVISHLHTSATCNWLWSCEASVGRNMHLAHLSG